MLFLASQLASPLRADSDRDGGSMDPQQMEERRAHREEKMLESLTKKLNLSADQQKSVKAILDQQGEKMQALNKETMEKHKALREEADSKITPLLNDEQKKKFDEWKTEKKEHFRKRLSDHHKK